jgi:hypothetical protein
MEAQASGTSPPPGAPHAQRSSLGSNKPPAKKLTISLKKGLARASPVRARAALPSACGVAVPQRASAWPPPLSQHGPLQRRLWWLSPPRRRLGAALLAAESRCFSVLRVDEQSVQSFRKRLRRTHGRSCRHQYARCISSGPWTSLSKSCTRSSSPPSRACALPMFAVHVCAFVAHTRTWAYASTCTYTCVQVGGWVGAREYAGACPYRLACTRKHPCAPVRVRRHGLAPNPNASKAPVAGST